MNVAAFLQALPLRKDIEVIIARLPERPLPALHRYRELEGLNRPREQTPARFAHQQVDMFGHDNIRGDKKVVAAAHGFKRTLEDISRSFGTEMGQPPVAREGHKVQVPGLLVANQASRHASIVAHVSKARHGAPRSHRNTQTWATRRFDQSSGDWVAVHIFQLLGRLGVAPNVEIVIAPLPKLGLFGSLQLSGGLLFQNLDCQGEWRFAGLAHQQVNVLGHEHVSRHHEFIAPPHPFQFSLEDAIALSICQPWQSSIAAKGEKMKLRRLLVTD
jgi:hypothetical protein